MPESAAMPAGRTPAPLGSVLGAMIALQALISGGIFGLGVAAPLIGLPVAHLGWLNALIFALGAFGASRAGELCRRWGGVHTAAACAACVLAANLLLCLPTTLAVWPAAILLGLAFGPETPASSASLVRVASPAQRNWVIALRQTGNQWGAIGASLCLPALLATSQPLAFGLLAVLCALLLLWLHSLREIDRPGPAAHPPEHHPTALLPTLAAQLRTRGMPALLALSASYAAMQVALNGFAFSFLVRTLELAPALAGLLLATAQAGGLIARLLLSAWARRAASTATALGWIGPGIAAAISALALLPAQPLDALPGALVFGLMFVAGFLVSGWNGLLLAELARLAGPSRTAAWTGAAMTVSYAGLVAAPLLFVLGAAHLRQIYLLLAGLCALSGLALLRTRTPLPGNTP